MFIDFPTILFLVAVVGLLIWILDYLYFQKKREGTGVEEGHWLVETSKAFFPVIVLVLLLRSFLVEPFRIPSPSMVPTLLPGDFILVKKYAYGVKLPVINQLLFNHHSPQRGEVVVFRFPDEPTTNYIKRVIGVPGDVIEYKDKKITVNGKPVAQDYDGKYVDNGAGSDFTGYSRMAERTGERRYNVLLSGGNPPPFTCLKNSRFTVKPGEYFVMGDNRDHSNDSRYWCGVPDANLVGKAFAIWMNYDPVSGKVRWSRMFEGID